jgi:hypothetical protein
MKALAGPWCASRSCVEANQRTEPKNDLLSDSYQISIMIAGSYRLLHRYLFMS